jgi:thioesterase domain-containing protein
MHGAPGDVRVHVDRDRRAEPGVTELEPQRLQELLYREIPLSRAMAVTVQACCTDAVVLQAPLGPNYNHQQNAFGGSLATLALLAGYGMVWSVLEHHALQAELVIQESTTRYLRPVTRDFAARCEAPDAAEIDRFAATLRRGRRARLRLVSTIHEDGALAVAFEGAYVALPD